MRILYLHEEILPNQNELAEQVYRICQGLANAGMEIHLACSRGSKSQLHLSQFYFPNHQRCRSVYLHFLWSAQTTLCPKAFGHWLFALQSEKLIRSLSPQWVLSANPKTLLYHLRRKRFGVHYGLEIGNLPFFNNSVKKNQLPNLSPVQSKVSYTAIPREKQAELLMWREALKRTDLTISPTQGLKNALLSPPYIVPNIPHVIPLGSSLTPLPPVSTLDDQPVRPLFIATKRDVDQIPLMMSALRICINNENLQLVIASFDRDATEMVKKEIAIKDLEERATLIENPPPSKMSQLYGLADGFIVLADETSLQAHSKLIDFCRLGRPIIAPDLPIICEQLPEGQARAFLFAAGNIPALAIQLRRFLDPTLRFLTTSALHDKLENNPYQFSLEQKAQMLKQLFLSQVKLRKD